MRKVRENKKKSTKTIVKKSKPQIKRKKTKLLSSRLKLIFTYCATFCVVSAVCLFLSSTILFKIKEIVVQGDAVCEAQVLVEKSGIKKGDNLFLANTAAASEKLEEEIPEIDTVTMTKKFPNKLVMDVKRAEKAFCVEHENSYVCISNKGKVLEIAEERDENLPLLRGVRLDFFEIGKKIIYSEKSVAKKLAEFVEKMNANGLSKITEIDFNNGFSFFVCYDNRVKINFGFYENIDYKIKTAAEIINNKLGAAESGTLDLSEISKENRSYFTPDY